MTHFWEMADKFLPGRAEKPGCCVILGIFFISAIFLKEYPGRVAASRPGRLPD
jgi:hypothetical protein